MSELRINYKEVRFGFSFIDLLRYKHWLKQKDEQDKLDQLHKVIDEIMLDAQRYF